MASILWVPVVKSTIKTSFSSRTGLLLLSLRASSTSTSDKSYQYLKISKIPTDKFQKSLPRLGIPYLDKSVGRYLDALEPIIPSKEQFEEAKKAVNTFKDGIGKELQIELVAENKRNKHTSYICKPWFDMYLKSRLPLVLNYNPFMAWKDDPVSEYNTVPIRATNMLISALRFRRSLVENVLPPEVFHLKPATNNEKYRKVIGWSPEFIATYVSIGLFQAFPLDMSQFGNLFSSTRIPRKDRDELKTYPNSRHVAVLKNGQFFTFDVLDASGDLRDPQSLFSLINHLNSLKVDQKQDSITTLSAEDRDKWAAAREELVTSSALNSANLELIDSALFTISLDEIGFQNTDADLLDGAHNYLHGNSVKQGDRPLNRWFDKSFGMLFDCNGHASITFEHSWGDGVAVLRAFNEIYEDSCEKHFVGPKTESSKQIDAAQEVKHLKFELNSKTKSYVADATKHWKQLTSRLDLNYVKHGKLNRNYFKQQKLSPDSMFQLAFQMAFYKVYKTTVPTYESCSTAAFKHGRTEVVRAATSATKDTCEAFADKKNYSAAELRSLLDACSKKHFVLTKDAAMGQGFDRHLFALRTIAEKKGLDVPFFKDKSYLDASHYVLSTSTLFGEYFSGGGFAPVVEDGYGLGYGYVDDTLGMLCASYKGQRDGKKLVAAFVEALEEIHEVLEQSSVKK